MFGVAKRGKVPLDLQTGGLELGKFIFCIARKHACSAMLLKACHSCSVVPKSGSCKSFHSLSRAFVQVSRSMSAGRNC